MVSHKTNESPFIGSFSKRQIRILSKICKYSPQKVLDFITKNNTNNIKKKIKKQSRNIENYISNNELKNIEEIKQHIDHINNEKWLRKICKNLPFKVKLLLDLPRSPLCPG